jgi:transcriptional regulator with XRE-family HTH domain
VSDIRKRLIARLRELRKLHGITQEQFSEQTGFSYKFYQLIEIGRKCDLRLSSLERLAKAYGIQVHELLAPEIPKTHFPKTASKRVGRDVKRDKARISAKPEKLRPSEPPRRKTI